MQIFEKEIRKIKENMMIKNEFNFGKNFIFNLLSTNFPPNLFIVFLQFSLLKFYIIHRKKDGSGYG